MTGPIIKPPAFRWMIFQKPLRNRRIKSHYMAHLGLEVPECQLENKNKKKKVKLLHYREVKISPYWRRK